MLFRFILSLSTLVVSAGFAVAEYRLTILHTNDFHAWFEPISKYDSACDAVDNTAGKCLVVQLGW